MSSKKPTDQDTKFLAEIAYEIQAYALIHGLDPNATLRAVAVWISALLELTPFDHVEAGGAEE